MDPLKHKPPIMRYLTPLKYLSAQSYEYSANFRAQLMRDRMVVVRDMHKKDLKGHFGCVNAIEFSNQGGEYIASGGDDRRVLLWKVEDALSNRCRPLGMKGEHHSNIFCIAFDSANKRIYSGGNDEQVVVHDLETREILDVFTHKEAVYGLSVDPVNDCVFASACDDGRVLIYDIRLPPSEEPFVLANHVSPMHAVMYNPVEPRLLATANNREGIQIWDVRSPRRSLMRYGSRGPESCMSVRINASGTQLVALRRRLPPVLYNIDSPHIVHQFDHPGYYNSCTMKSCCFAGDNDQYILSGSDNFSLYLWKIPDEPSTCAWVPQAHMVLKGHRSIVNQVRFNPANHLIVSSGVEKVIKMWSLFALPGSDAAPEADIPQSHVAIRPERPVYTHEEYINLVLRSGQGMTHDYTTQSTEEDPRMMAFFDSLVQRELEGWSSDDNDSDTEEFNFTLSDSENASVSSDDEDGGGLSPFTIAFASVLVQRERETAEGIAAGGDGTEAGVRADSGTSARDNSDGDTAAELERAGTEAPREHVMHALLENMMGLAGGEDAAAPADDDTNGEDASADETLPGQNRQSARRSISMLIAQKRKEYLNAVKRHTEESSKQSEKRRGRRLLKQMKKVDRAKNTMSSSSSDSDSAAAGSSSRESSPSSSTSSCSSPSSSSSSSSVSASELSSSSPDDMLSQLQAQQQQRKAELQQLKRLRQRIMNGDDDSPGSVCSTSDSGIPRKISKLENTSNDLEPEPQPSCSQVGITSSPWACSDKNCNSDQNSLNVAQNGKCNNDAPSNTNRGSCDNGLVECSDIGPRLIPTTHKDKLRSLTCGCGKVEDGEFSSNNIGIIGSGNPAATNNDCQTHIQSACNCEKVAPNKNGSLPLLGSYSSRTLPGIRNGTGTDALSHSVTSPSTESASDIDGTATPTSENLQTSGQSSNYQEFKRFKNRVERARRNYRRQSQSDGDSS